jgi:GDP-L-fucose synthase
VQGVENNQVIFVAGGTTLVGAALVRCLRRRKYPRVLGDEIGSPDLADRRQVDEFFAQHRPAYVFHAAGDSGGIRANQLRPAELCRDNLAATVHVLAAAHRQGVRRLLYLASSCCYPRNASQPSAPEHLWTGPLEPTSEAYAAAKLAGIALCRSYCQQYEDDFRVAIPANPFGPGDEMDERQAHVISSLIMRMHAAKLENAPQVIVWGTGTPRREFLFADDLADACVFVMNQPHAPAILNLGSGESLTIGELAQLIADVVGYRGQLVFDASQPDGAPRKELDSSALHALGWQASTPLPKALAATYAWFLAAQPAPAAGRLMHAR